MAQPLSPLQCGLLIAGLHFLRQNVAIKLCTRIYNSSSQEWPSGILIRPLISAQSKTSYLIHNKQPQL